MQLGIIGLPQSGKTTLFNALTGKTQATGKVSGRFEVNTAVVDVPDPRVDQLSAMFSPKKTTYAKVTYADIAGLDGSSGKQGISGELINQLAKMDGYIHVVRCFENDMVPHQAGSVDPVRDIQTMDTEFILNDLLVVERKLTRLEDEKRKGGGRDKAVILKEVELFNRLQDALNEEKPLRDLELTDEELKNLSGYGLLSTRPVLVTLNLGDGQEAPEIEYNHEASYLVGLQGRLEMEIAQLPVEEREMFLEEYGIEEPSLNRMIRLSYDLLGLQSFFTYGPDEVRAWTISRNALAPEAAGAIHSDLQKGFIRAEVIHYDELMELGSIPEAKAKGKLRLEGKQYPVKDGDLITIRFNI